jgi:hypothetical protein
MRWSIVGVGSLLAQVCVAAPVTELIPQELAAFVAKHEYVVVQMTSPDLNCGYCKGADDTFDRAAALPHEPKLVYARVQWKPWREIPDFGPLVRVYGVPEQYVFRNGKALGGTGGRPASAAGLLTQVDQVIADPSFLRPKQEPVADQPVQPLSDTERASVKLGIRRDFLTAVSSACGRLFPTHKANYDGAVQSWRAANEAGLKQADVLMLTRTSRADALAMRPLAEEEKRSLQSWQTGKLGISQQGAPTMADCDKFYSSLAGLP